MPTLKPQPSQLPARFSGYLDLNGGFVPFEAAEEVFVRAQTLGTRVLLRLRLDDRQELHGTLYTNNPELAAG